MGASPYARHLRIGLQLKSALILAFIVLAVTVASGWFYHGAARESFRGSDRQHAVRLAQALGLAAQYDLQHGHDLPLQRLVTDLLADDSVRYVALLDSAGMVVASAGREADRRRWSSLTEMPLTVSTTREVGRDLLVLARPIIVPDAIWWKDRLAGAVRVVVDTHATAARLAAVQRRMAAVAVAIVLCGIPAGLVLVWQLMLKPLRKLATVTGRLAKGDFGARSGLKRGDEIGRLGAAFDSMADDLARMRDELLGANEQLERKVTERTGELEVTNRRLREEMGEKEDFIRAVSHDLNAPLRNIAGMATMVVMKWRDELPEEVAARLQRIQANVDVGSSLIGELLELSRIKTRPEKRETVDMRALMDGLAETFEYELKARGIELAIDEAMPSLHVERNRMRQVFQNLIDNAIKYMDRGEGGLIRVGYRLAGGGHEFSVADNGPGIPPDQLQSVFCVFRRAETAATARVQGKGVGLALVKSVVSNHDGRAWAESPPGQGVTFLVSLPVRSSEPPAMGAELHDAECDNNVPADHYPVGR